MFGFKKNKQNNQESPENTQEPKGLMSRLKNGLARTRKQFTRNLSSLVLGAKEIDDDLIEEIETLLLTADVGMEATTAIIDDITARLDRKELKDSSALFDAIEANMKILLERSEQALVVDDSKKPFVILMVGVNGVGKTTTIGKLAKRLQLDGKKVMLAAGDTFRAAAVEQLQTWGERNQVPVIAQHSGADSAAVIFDALQAAQARGMDVLI
ncbi:MAG: signal recognition particle receptor subunit alpha, partial [Gammaproteobacteria bacterium]|nr:signal recognition particle receptor subunit alpha [Gammaproteobacteria bacterium]